MKVSVAFALVCVAFAPALSAQWPDYPTSGSKTRLDAPAPRTADGHPDFSGVWENVRGNIGPRPAGFPPPEGGPPPGGPRPGGNPSPPPPPAVAESGPPRSTFFNVGAGFKEGLPLKPWAAEVLKKRAADNSKDNPDAHCLPMGLMQLHEHPQPRKIIQTPGLTLIVYEANSGLRQIFTDGRALPSKDAQPWWYGYSVGHWDGDTLVVETTGFRDDVWLDVNGSPLTNAGKMTEKFRRPTFGKLNIEITIEDPSAYTKPFTVQVNQQIMQNTDLIEFICAENERSDSHLVGK